MAYTVSAQTPSLGYISWSNVHIVFDGVDYTVTDGSTNKKNAWWKKSAPTVLQTTDAEPALGPDDALVFINRSGVPTSVLDSTAVDGGMIVPGTVMAKAIAAGAVRAEHLSAGAVTADAIDSYAINAEHLTVNAIEAQHITAEAIQAEHIGAGVVTAGHLAAGSVTAYQIAAGAVKAFAIEADAIEAQHIATGAVTADAIAAGSVLASSLVVSDSTNIYPDFDMKDGSFYSSSDGAVFSFIGNNSGSLGARYLSVASNAAQVSTATGWFPVEPGADYLVRAGAWLSSAASDTSASVSLELGTVASDGSVTSSRTVAVKTGATSAFNSTTAFSSVNVTTSSTEKRARFVLVRAGGGAVSARMGGLRITRRASGSLIVDGAIAANHLAVDSVTAGSIKAGEVTASKIATGAITTDKLFVTGRGAALNADPACQDASAWAKYSGAGTATFVTGLTDGVSGTTAMRGGPGTCWYNGAELIPLDPNKTYRFRARARKSGSSADGSMYLGVALFDASGANITGDGTQWHYINNGGAFSAFALSTTFTPYTGTFGAGVKAFPANARYMKPLVILSYGGTAGYMEVQDVRIEERASSDLIVDGAITTAKLDALAVTAPKIAAATITGDKIAANTISAGNIVAGTITANELAANAVVAGKIAAGAVSATEIAAGAIRTSHLAVVPQTLNPDPNFDDRAMWRLDSADNGSPPSGNASGGGWYTSVPTEAVWPGLGGSKCIFLWDGNPGGAPGTNRFHAWTLRFSLPFGGQTLRLRVRIRNVCNQYVHILCRQYDANGNSLGDILLQSNGGSGYQDLSAKAQVPAGTAYGEIIVYNQGAAAGGGTFVGSVAVCQPLLDLAAGADLIVDGAVTATKLAAGSIAVGTAAIANGAITNAMVNDLSADKINAGYLNAARIQAGTIDASKINSNGLMVKDTSGTVLLGSGTALHPSYAAAGTVNNDLLPDIAEAAGTTPDNLWTGDLAAISGSHPTYGGSISNGAYSPDPRGGNRAAVVALPSVGAYVSYHVFDKVGRPDGWYKVTLKLLVAAGMSIVVTATDGSTWDNSFYERATTTSGTAQWVQVTVKQYLNSSSVGLEVVVGSFWKTGFEQWSTPSTTSVPIADLVVVRDEAVDKFNQIKSTNVSTYIANAAIQDAQIGNLSAGKITAGTIDAARIGAGSITADKINGQSLVVYSGAFSSSWAWPAAGAGGGFLLHGAGLLLGNANTPGAGYLALGSDGSLASRQFSIDSAGNASFSGLLTAGKVSVGPASGAAVFIDPAMPTIALRSICGHTLNYSGYAATNPGSGWVPIYVTGDAVKFKCGDGSWDIERRVRSGSVLFLVSVSAAVQDYLSAWYRVNGGSWTNIAYATEYASGQGTAAITVALTLTVAQNDVIEFAMTSTTNTGTLSPNGAELNNGALTVLAKNF